VSPAQTIEAAICAGDDAEFDFNVGSVEGFDMPVTLSAVGQPDGATANFSPNPVTPLPGTSTLTIGNTGGATAGEYDIDILATASGVDDRETAVELSVFDAIPATPALTTPANAATDVGLNPTFEWSEVVAEEYVIEIATDPGFTNMVLSETTEDNEFALFEPLASNTTYFWRVRGSNACGPSSYSTVFSFTTQALPGDCPVGQTEVVVHTFDFESGAQGWTSGTNLGTDTWTLSTANPNNGAQHWHADDNSTPSDTFLRSPSLAIPNGLSSLTFRFFNDQRFEAPPTPTECWDGGMLEVSTNGGGVFSEVVDGDLLTDPYDGVLRNTSENPLGNRDAWCDVGQPYTDSRVDISSLAGQNDVVFRFRIGTDVSAGAPGWDIDDVKVIGCSNLLEFEDGFEEPPVR
jgi:hypothetical protein